VAPPRHGGMTEVHGNFDHYVKGHLEVPSNHGDYCAPSHACPYPSRCYTPDFESDEETTESYGTLDPCSTPPVLVVPSVQGPILTGLDRPSPRVRFRSRVRISAGRRRRLSDGSPSSSPSSSISAPLRTHYTGSNGWSPLGTRVGSSRLRSATHASAPIRSEIANGGKGSPSGDWDVWEQDARPSEIDRYDVDEHTCLITSTTRPFYATNRHTHDSYHQYHDDSERRWKEQLMDQVFGKWPYRLLNRHWWWWHLEPVLCCLCYPDDEEECIHE